MSARSLPLRGLLWVVVGAGLVPFAGCVSYQKYDQVRRELDRANRVNEDLVSRLNQKMLREKSGAGEAGIAPAAYDKLAAENARLTKLLGEARNQQSFTEEDRAQAGGSVLLEEGGLSLGSDLLFASGVANLRKGHLAELDGIADVLKTKYPGEKIIIEGHTDTEPLKSVRGLYEDNWNLGYHRARAVFKYFKEKHLIPEDQMLLVTYGYMKPVAANDTEDGRARNRRVVIRRGGMIRGMLTRR